MFVKLCFVYKKHQYLPHYLLCMLLTIYAILSLKAITLAPGWICLLLIVTNLLRLSSSKPCRPWWQAIFCGISPVCSCLLMSNLRTTWHKWMNYCAIYKDTINIILHSEEWKIKRKKIIHLRGLEPPLLNKNYTYWCSIVRVVTYWAIHNDYQSNSKYPLKA